MIVFDREGNFLTSWGDDILVDAHGIFIDAKDNIYCVERDAHIMHKFTSDGELLMSVGTPRTARRRRGTVQSANRPRARSGWRDVHQ